MKGLVLHVGCMPFPSFQGTQAAIGRMLDVAASSGRETHLLTYAHGAYETSTSFVHHRLRDFPKSRSLRSGPSFGKVALDLSMVAKVRQLDREYCPRAFVAHHIEAAIVLLAARVAPVCYVAHTSIEAELPLYFSTLHGVFKQAGLLGDHIACRSAERAAAISPMMAASLSQETKAEVRYLPIPWNIADRVTAKERRAARQALNIPEIQPVLLYAGNLDAYQGWEDVVRALAIVNQHIPPALLLVATESDPVPLIQLSTEIGVLDHVRVSRLCGEDARRQVHAAANVAIIPRKAPGGLPIKLLEALSRGTPVIATVRATAGLSLGPACTSAKDDDPEAIASAVIAALSNTTALADQVLEGHEYLGRAHSPDRFLDVYDKLVSFNP